jgi:hypothetical protein
LKGICLIEAAMAATPEREARLAAALALLERLPPAEAELLHDHLRALAAEAVRQGMLLAATLMMAARDVAIDFDGLARTLPATRRYLPPENGRVVLAPARED